MTADYERIDALARRLHSHAIHLLRRVRREDAALGVSPARLSALSVIGFGGPCTLGELAAAEQVRPPTMSRIVDAMEREGLAVREPDPADGRLTRVAATERGVALLMEGQSRRAGRLAAALERLSPEEFETVERATALLDRVIDDLR